MSGRRGPRTTFVALASLGTLAATAGAVALSGAPASASRSGERAGPTTIVVAKTSWGPILALSTGWTVYRFVKDSDNHSTCFGACAKAWPPVLLAPGQRQPIGKGVEHLGSISRPGGQHEVTYQGIPLYLFVGDKKPGQVTGNIKDKFGQWWVVNPAHPMAVPHSSTPTTTSGGGGVAY
ncbi:MAG TPA: hypothetical protein VME46_21785 [Acidimicrobiales bacterium]|nr:hypothetical protein [Acidimicrobiales bacterium]